MIRVALAVVAGVAWMVTLPMAANALLVTEDSWATVGFVPAALVTAGAWWTHMKERERRIGVAGVLSGWLLVGSVALLGLAGYFWMLVAMAVVASTIAYGVLLLVTQSGADSPRLDLATGLLLFATGGAAALFSGTTGLGHTEAWWMPAHIIVAIGVGIATIASGMGRVVSSSGS